MGIFRTLLGVFALAFAVPAFAQTYTYSIYVDSDNNPATGCSASFPGGNVVGAEQMATVSITAGSPPQIGSITQSICASGAFGAGTSAGNAAVGVGAGSNGATAIEISTALANLAGNNTGSLRLYIVAQSATGSDVLLTTTGAANGAPILLDVSGGPVVNPGGAIPAPLLGLPMALLLVVALLVFGSRAARRRWMKRVLTGLVLISGIAGASIFNWNGIAPLASDPSGDASNADPSIDLTRFYAALNSANLYFRLDVVGNLAAPAQAPLTVADSYTTSLNTVLNTPAPGVLSNDTPNGATIGANTNPAHGTLALNANGGFVYTPSNGYTGGDSFTYTLSNSGGSSTATVSLNIVAGPVAIADSYTTNLGTALSIPAPGILGNDQLGSPSAALSSFGGGSLGGAVTDYAPGATATLAGANLSIGADGNIALTAPTAAGTYTFQYRISNSQGNSDGTVTVQVNAAPTITSAASTTLVVGTAGSFSVTASGTPAPAITLGGTPLPSGITFVDKGNGSGSLAGTPAAGTGGGYAITFTATNSAGSSAPQGFTLTVNQAPAITSANAAAFSVGASGTFTVVATGSPTPTITQSGALPNGVSFNASTGVLSGTPDTGSSGTYPLTFTASNGVGAPAVQNFILTVQVGPAITSANTATFVVGTAGTFTVTSSGTPTAVLSASGVLPGGVTFIDNNDGTATLAGTPAAGSAGDYPLTFTASNGVGTDTTQNFTLVVQAKPSAVDDGYDAVTGQMLTVPASGVLSNDDLGSPAATLLSFGGGDLGGAVTDNTPGAMVSLAGGTLTIAADGSLSLTSPTTPGVYTLQYQIGNVADISTATVTITVNQPPTIVGGATATANFIVGTNSSFDVTTTGVPTVTSITLAPSCSLPPGLTFSYTSGATATISGSATAGGSATCTVTASNGIGTDATQTLTITASASAAAVDDNGPAYTTTVGTTLTVPASGVLTNDALGFPLATLTNFGGGSLGGAVTDNAAGTSVSLAGGTLSIADDGSLSLTTPMTPGTYTVIYRIANTQGTSDATITLQVNEAPKIISPDNYTVLIGTPANFTITTSGTPDVTSIALSACTLPTGLNFAYTSGTTATISGTPSIAQSVVCTVTASNGISPDATQQLTVNVNEGPAAVADTLTTTLNTPLSLNAASGLLANDTLGNPIATLTSFGGNSLGTAVTDNAAGASAALAGGSLTVNADGSVSLTAPATSGQYTFLYRIDNGVSTSDALVTLNVNEAPAITTTNAATFIVAQSNNFSVMTSGFPKPALSAAGALPNGVSFTDNGDGSGKFTGSPAAGSGGSYPVTITASNGIGSDAVQNFVLSITEAPQITSANTTTFTVGTMGSFNVTASGTPGSTFSETGALPSGVSLSAAGLLSGTPDPSTGGSYPITLTASNGVGGNATQSFTLIVDQAAAITSTSNTTFTVGTNGTFSVTTTGYPNATIATASVLPGGVTLVDNGNGSATLSGTPAAGTGGAHSITITAHNGVGSDASQTFTLNINEAPAFTSAATATFTVGTLGSFTVTASGTPAPTFTSSALPSGLSLTTAGVLSGTPAPSTGGSYAIAITATNGTSPNATQNFTLIVQQPPAFTSGTSTTFPIGVAGSFSLTASGYPVPTFTVAPGSLPGGVTLASNGLLSGTPQPGTANVYSLTLSASNGVGTAASQAFTLTVSCPVITVTNNSSLPNGLYNTPYSAPAFTQSGGVVPIAWSAAGLPASLTIGSGTGAVSGTPNNTIAAASGTITATDANLCTGTLAFSGVKIAPLASNDSYATVGNTQLYVATAAPATPYLADANTLLNNDQGPGTLSVSAVATTTNGGSVSVAGTGGFVFTPKAGDAAASDSFTYTLTDGNGVTNTATVTITRTNRVWYVNGTVAGPGTGLSNDPFASLAGASTAHLAGDTIFVESVVGAPTSTPGAVSLKANTKLWGQGTALPAIGAFTITNTNATSKPKLANTVTIAGNGVTVSSLDIASTTNTGLNDTGVVATPLTTATVQNNVTVTTTTGKAIDLAYIGGTFAFGSISANGAANGIALNNTTGTFTVQGDGGGSNNGSGGTIQNTTGAAVLITAAQSVGLNYLNITNPGASGINATAVNGFTLNRANLIDSGGAANDDGVQLTNAQGVVLINGTAITGAPHNGITLSNVNTNLASFTLSGSAINNIVLPNGNDGLYISTRGSSTITTATLTGNTFTNIYSTAIQVQADNFAVLANLTIGGAAAGAANMITGNGLGIDIDHTGTANIVFSVLNNTFTGQQSHALNLFSSDTLSTGGTISGKIDGNKIGTVGVLDSGSLYGAGVRVANNGGVPTVLTISNNALSEIPNGRGFDITGAHTVAGGGGLRVKLTGNSVNRPSGTAGNVCGLGTNVPCPLASVFVASDNFESSGNETVCSIVSGNTAYDPTSYTYGAEAAFYLQENTFTGPSTHSLGGTQTTALAEITTTNTVTNSASSPVFIDGAVGVVPVANCGTFP